MIRIIRTLSMILVFGLTVEGCKQSTPSSGLLEFEFSEGLCGDLQQATESRWSASGKSKEVFFADLVSTERTIIDYELTRYRQRLAEMEAGTGPANGPGGDDVPLVGAPGRDEAEPASSSDPADPVVSADETTDTPILPLTQTSDDVSLAQEVCAGCSIEEVRQKLAILETNQQQIGSCQLPAASVSTASMATEETLTPEEQAAKQKDVNAIKDIVMAAANPKALCEWWGTVSSGTGANRDRCQRETINGFCTAALNAAVNGTTTGVTGGTDEAVVTEIAKTIPGAVKTAIVGCVQQLAYDTVKNALREAGTRQFLPSATQQIASQAIQGDNLSQQAKDKKMADLRKEIALLICKAGTELIANQIEEEPQINYDNPCRAIFQGSKSRAKACLNTTGSICGIAAGDVQLTNFLPEGAIDEQPLANLVAEAGNTIASAGCSAGGISAVCGTISAAAGQIRQALTTGNNDWAHCAGTDQMGACGGTIYAEWLLGVDNEDASQPVRPAVASTEAPGYYEKDVCWCYYSCYQDDWGSNTELSRSNYYTVISNAGAGERECSNLEGRWDWTGSKSKDDYHLFWKKHQCEIVRARSRNNDGFASTGYFEVKISGSWVNKRMSSESGSCPANL